MLLHFMNETGGGEKKKKKREPKRGGREEGGDSGQRMQACTHAQTDTCRVSPASRGGTQSCGDEEATRYSQKGKKKKQAFIINPTTLVTNVKENI